METIESLKADIARLKSAWHVETLVLKDALIAKQEAENDRLNAELKAQQSPACCAELRKWYVKLTNADNVQDGINVNGKHCTDEMMDEFERILERQSPAVAAPDNKFGDNLLWFLREFANADDDQLEYAELEIHGESESGVECTCTATVQEICKAAADVIESLNQSPRITEQDAREIATQFFYWWHNQPGTNTMQGFGDWLEFEGRALLDKLNGVAE